VILALMLACQGDPSPSASPPTTPEVEPSVFAMDASAPARHALLVVIDTLRADLAAEAATPHLDALDAAGASVPRAWSAGTWTVPSVVSLFTGMSVRQHGYDERTGQLGRYPLLPEVPMLAQELESRGFACEGFFANPYLSEELGFDRGFTSWRRSVDKVMPEQLAQSVSESWGDGQRHFAYIHLIGPHSPLRPGPEARARHDLEDHWFEDRKDLNIGRVKRSDPPGVGDVYTRAYKAVVEDTDARLGQLIEALGPHRKDTVILVTSDHGELLGEHDIAGHGYWVWEPLTHVPLVVDHPGVPGPEESLPATLGIASVPALLFHALGLEGSWSTAADAALPLVAQREGKLALSSDGHTKGVWHTDQLQVFDLRNDPDETRPLASDQGLVEARTRWEASVPEGTLAAASGELDPATRAELEVLGYTEQTTTPAGP